MEEQSEGVCVRGVLPEGEGWIKGGGNVWTARGGDFSAVAIPLGDVPGGSVVSEL